MIAAIVAPWGSSACASWQRTFDRIAGHSPAIARAQSSLVLAYPGYPPGQLVTPQRRASIGQVREFSFARPERCRGDFALVALGSAEDGAEGELLLVRGRFGGRPLFYAFDPSSKCLVVCSRLGALAQALNAAIHPDGLAAHIVWSLPIDRSQSLYQGIRRVPSACALRMSLTGVHARHELRVDIRPRRDGVIDALADELRQHVKRATSRAIAHLDEVGVLVSGGLDSSFLLAEALEAAAAAGKPAVHAINLEFAGPGDDRPPFRALCAQLGVLPVLTRPRDSGPLFLQSLVMDGAPATWPTAPFDIRLTQLGREQGATAVLTGVGGDDVFNGDFRILADGFRHGRIFASLRRTVRLKGYANSSARFRLRRFLAMPIVRDLLPKPWLEAIDARRRRPRALRWAGPRLRRNIADGLLAEEGPDPRERPTERSSLCHAMGSSYYAFLKESHALIEIAGGCTRIDPYFDDDLVEFLASLRPGLLFHGDWVRGLFRQAMRGAVPEDVHARPDKGGYGTALLEVLRAAGGFEVLRPLVSMVGLADHGIVDPAAFQERFRQFEETPLDGGLWMELWPVFAAEACVRGLPGLP